MLQEINWCVFKHFVQLEFQVSTWYKCQHVVLSGVYTFLSSDKKLWSVSALKEQDRDGAKFQAELTNIQCLKNEYFFLTCYMKIELRIECENLPTKTEIITQSLIYYLFVLVK
jgi:hypothetical protein